MTASCTVPFLIVPSGDASLTVTLIRSPRLAIFPVEPPMGMIISTRLAPELSATSSEVCIWITVVTSDHWSLDFGLGTLGLASSLPNYCQDQNPKSKDLLSKSLCCLLTYLY